MLRKVALAVLACLAATTHPAAAQEAGRAQTVCVLPLADLGSRPGADPALGEAIASIVESMAGDARFLLAPRERGAQAAARVSERDMVRGPVALKVASAAGADFVINGFYRQETGDRLFIQLKGYDVAGGRIVAAVSASARSGLAVYSATRQAAARLYAALAAPPPPPAAAPPAQPEAADTVRVTLLSPDEGAEVLLAGTGAAGSITNGALFLRVPAGTDLIFDLRKPGYHTRRQTLRPPADAEVELRPLVPATRLAVGMLVAADTYAGAGVVANLYLRPDRLYVGVEERLARSLPGEEVDAFRNDLRLALGAHLLAGPGSRVRLGYSAALGLETSNLFADQGPKLDLTVSPAVVGIEVNFTSWIAFARIEATYQLPVGADREAPAWRTWSPRGREWLLPPLSAGLLRKLR